MAIEDTLAAIEYLSTATCGSSTSSVAMGTGSKTFVLVESSRTLVPGAAVVVSLTADESYRLIGTVTSWTSGTKTLVMNVVTSTGTGTFNAWIVRSTSTLYYSEMGHTTTPSDAVANQWFDPRMVGSASIKRSCWGEGATRGRTAIGNAVIELMNADNALDGLLAYGFDGQTLTLRKGTHRAAYSSFVTYFTGVSEQPVFNDNGAERSLTISARDTTHLFDQPLLRNKYGGTNVLPAGIDGTVDDLKGKYKPLAMGVLKNITPIFVNTSKMIYQMHDGPLGPGWSCTVRDMGAPYTAGADYTSQSDMELTAPAVGQVRFWPGGGCFRLNAKPLGQVTCDLTNPPYRNALVASPTINTATDEVTCSLFSGIATTAPVAFYLLDSTGVLPAPLVQGTTYYPRLISGSTVTLHPSASDAAANLNKVNLTTTGTATFGAATQSGSLGYRFLMNELCKVALGALGNVDHGGLPSNINVGIYITEQTNLKDALDLVGAGPNIRFSNNGTPSIPVVKLRRFEAPPIGTTFNIVEADVKSLALRPGGDESRGIPVWRVTVKYRKNWTIQQGADLTGTVSAANVAYYAEEYRSAVWTDLTVKQVYPSSPELIVESLFDSETDASTEAARLGTLHGVLRKTLDVTVPFESYLYALDLLDTVFLTHSQYGLSAGANFVVLGYSLDQNAEWLTLTLWG